MRYNIVINRKFQNIRVYKIVKKMNDRSNKISRAVMKLIEKKLNGGKEL